MPGLGYPAGVAPGFDRTHPAATGALVSAVASGGNLLNLVSGIRGTVTGAVTNVTETLGPVANIPNTGAFSRITLPIPSGPNTDPYLLAAIIRFDSVPGSGSEIIAQYVDVAAGLNLRLLSGEFGYYFGGGSLWNGSGFFLSAGVPYFLLAECWTGKPQNFAVADLSTGTTRFNFNPAVNGPAGAPTTLLIGNNATLADEGLRGNLAALCYGIGYLTPDQIRAWCADPWSFWYPRAPPALVASAIVVQLLRPDADDSISDWTDQGGGTATLYAAIDETTASDTDYIQSPAPPNTSTARFRLSDPTTGKTLADPVIVRYRFRKTTSDDQKLDVTLKQGTTTIATWQHTGGGLTTSFQTAAQTLTAPQLASISDFNSLYIEFQASPP